VENTRAAGILVVVSAGNSGPSCASVDAPPAIYDASFSVGATNDSDGVASFSSRGPVEIDGSMRLKPDVSAPGVGIRSSLRGGAYGNKSGTSMAGPHVAGLAALLISAHPELAGDVDALEAAITSSALPLTTSQGCGGDTGNDVPNHTFGYGRIDALAAVSGVPTELPSLSPGALALAAASLLVLGWLKGRPTGRERSRKEAAPTARRSGIRLRSPRR